MLLKKSYKEEESSTLNGSFSFLFFSFNDRIFLIHGFNILIYCFFKLFCWNHLLNDLAYQFLFAYTCRKYTGKLQNDEDEAIDLKFFSLKELPINISPPDKLVLDYYLNASKQKLEQLDTRTV